MAQTNNPSQPREQAPQNPPADTQSAPGDGRSADDTTATAAEFAALQQAQAEVADLRSRLARWQADFQNLQRRSAREILEAKQAADADFAKSLLTVLDHFDMALNVDPAKTDAATLLNGVKITYDELKKTLAHRGIESYDPTGEPFDPHLHEAIMQEASTDQPPMTVIQTFQPGYRIGERVLRPAKVKVSK